MIERLKGAGRFGRPGMTGWLPLRVMRNLLFLFFMAALWSGAGGVRRCRPLSGGQETEQHYNGYQEGSIYAAFKTSKEHNGLWWFGVALDGFWTGQKTFVFGGNCCASTAVGWLVSGT